MSKAGDVAKASAIGGFHLLWGLVASTLIASVGSIFIARLLGPDLYGLYVIVLTAPSLIGVFRDWGVNVAVVRCEARYRSEGRMDELRSVLLSGLIFEIALGLLLSLLSFVFSDFLAVRVFNRPVIAPLIQLASLSILASGLINLCTGIFTGMDRMELNSVMLIFQSSIKTLLVTVLVIVGLGTSGAIIGYTTGLSFAAIIGLLLMWTIYRHLPKPSTSKFELKAYLGTILKYALPLSVAGLITGFMAQFYSFLLPIYYATDNSVIGNYGVAANFVVLIGFVATPVITMLFPAFSKLDAKKDKEALKTAFQLSVKYSSLLIVPVAFLVMCLAEPAVSVLFGTTYNSAAFFLALIAISYLYVTFGSLSVGSLINSQGQTQYTMKLAALTGAIGFPMGYALIMNFGILGLIVSSLIAVIPSSVIGLRYIHKNYDVTVDWPASAKIFLSCMIVSVLTYFAISILNFSSLVELILGVIIFVLLVIPLLLLTKSINTVDIENLRTMVSSIGGVGKILNKVLALIEKLMTLF